MLLEVLQLIAFLNFWNFFLAAKPYVSSSLIHNIVPSEIIKISSFQVWARFQNFILSKNPVKTSDFPIRPGYPFDVRLSVILIRYWTVYAQKKITCFSCSCALYLQTLEWRVLPSGSGLTSAQLASSLLSLSEDNTTLTFHPFSAERYSSQIHAQRFQCAATSLNVGTIVSAPINVRAGKIRLKVQWMVAFFSLAYVLEVLVSLLKLQRWWRAWWLD